MQRPANGLVSYQMYVLYGLFLLKFPCLTESTPRILHHLWGFMSWFSVFLPLHLSLCHAKAIYEMHDIENLSEISNIGIQGLWLLCGFVSMLNFKLMSKQLGNMFREIDETFLWTSPKGLTYITTEKCYRYARFISIMWQVVPQCSVVLNLLRPLFQRPQRLPSVDWYFLDLDNTFNFAVAYFLQSWSQVAAVFCLLMGSTLFHTCATLCCGQFNILRCTLKNLVYISGVYKRFPETFEDSHSRRDSFEYHRDVEVATKLLVENTGNSSGTRPTCQPSYLYPDEINKIRNLIKGCVKHHLQLLRTCSHLNEFLNLFSLLRVFEVTLQMCSMAFVFQKTSDVIILLFGVFALFDLYLLTYPADYIQQQNESIVTSLTSGPWHLVAKYFRKDFIIIMAYAQRPIQFNAGKIVQLNASRLVSASRMAFSFYTFLSRLDSKGRSQYHRV